MIQRNSLGGTAYTVAEVDGVRHIFASACPRNDKDLAAQTRDAVATLAAIFEKEGASDSVVRQGVFLRHVEHVDECRQIVGQCYGDALPATTYIPQPPCNGKLLAVEAMAMVGVGDRVQVERHSEHSVVTRCDGVSWLHNSHVAPTVSAPHLYDRSIDCFKQLHGRLADHKVRFDQIVRTWLYLGDIVGPEGKTQRYKELNRARTDFYLDIPFGTEHLPSGIEGPVYPASTGIGTDGDDLIVSCMALATRRNDVRLVALENPQQTSAFEYEYTYGQRRPRFSRAMVVASGPYATTFISGTASITGSETQHPGDVAAQTQQTFDNIEALIGEPNFAQHGLPGRGATLRDLALVRVYIKRQDDYPAVRAICESRLGEVPTVYAVADVCRPDLLVEVEGLAFSRATG